MLHVLLESIDLMLLILSYQMGTQACVCLMLSVWRVLASQCTQLNVAITCNDWLSRHATCIALRCHGSIFELIYT